MIAVDTSALMAVLLGEPHSELLMDSLAAADRLIISAVTVAEALVVAERRNIGDEMAMLIDDLGFETVAVTGATAHRVAQIYKVWGKGSHPAALNFGDCFSYEIARAHECPLLFVGDDFAHTDIPPVS